jgi:hypothetical protein
MGISQEDNMKATIRFASLAMMLVMAVIGTTSQMWADQQVRFRARANKTINGFEAELRGDYREQNGPNRLDVSLEKINIPAGTGVAFCLVQNSVKTLIGVGQVGGNSPEASVELDANHGDTIPKVDVGDTLESHQRSKAPFIASPNCGSPLLLSAPFTK